MKINEDCINHNAVRMIKELTESRYDMIMEATAEERGYFLMAIGEIAGIIEMADAMDAIRDLPSAQPERKKGRWIVKEKGCKLTSYKCSECGRYIVDDTGYDVKKGYPFCHCGADMRGD